MDNRPNCTICDAENTSWLLNKNGHDIFRCKSCGHLFVFPIPSEGELKKIYSSESGYHLSKKVRFSADYVFKKSFAEQIGNIKKYLPKGLILDVGCSNGEFLYLAKMHGYEVQGVEINSDTANVAHENGIPVHVGTLEQAGFPDSQFDAVHLSDVVEHVRNPTKFLHEVNRVLKQKGLVVLNTPNHDAFFPKATLFLFEKFGIPWSHPTPPHHLNQFTPVSIGLLLNKSGFELIGTYYTPCSIEYEIYATCAPSELKKVLRRKEFARVLSPLAKTASVVLSYLLIGFIDRMFIWKTLDFDMNIVAVKKNSGISGGLRAIPRWTDQV